MSRWILRGAILVALIAAAVVAVLAWERRTEADPAWARCESNELVPRPEAVQGPPIEGVGTETVLEADFPTSLTVSPSDGWMFVGERAGRVLAVSPGADESREVLDLSAEVTLEGERGLLGLAVSPDGSKLYLNRTDLDGDTRIEEYGIVGPGEIDPASRREVLKVGQQREWHNGGALAFGPEGYLYIGLGDGGDHATPPDPEDDGQRLDSLLGSVLRIDPNPTDGEAYGIPPDNPFVDQPDARPEIWLKGVRNAWRLTIDEPTGDVWLADVGHFCFEEINVVPLDAGGVNLGWASIEGVSEVEGELPDDPWFPTYLYDHHSRVDPEAPVNCAIIGGDLYRGSALPQLDGGYVFSDFCDPRLRALWRDGDVIEVYEFGPELGSVVGFGTGSDRELYVLTQASVERLVPAT